MHPPAPLFALVLLAVPAWSQDEPEPDTGTPWGHSEHGAAYDAGPRQRPWIMEGIGATPFPITSADPEVQRWFDQGIALLHGFWAYEAERSFRWCLKLDPECAMAYWGMARATFQDSDRSAEFLEQAVARKDQVTPRERGYIDVAEAFAAVDEAEGDEADEARADAMVLIDRLIMDYPDDPEAKALYWFVAGMAMGEDMGSVRYGFEAVLDDILDLSPDHVGALHYRIHTWDGKEGRYAVESCMRLGEIGTGSGHLLHMPGHVLSGIGLWHEAGIAMDRATRVEKDYMHERMILPEENWNYVHNLDYLCYIQEQLGMVEQALIGGEQLLRSPAYTEGSFFRSAIKIPTMRTLLKFERWDELLEAGRIPWDEDSPVEALLSSYARTRATIGLGRTEEGRELLDELVASLEEESGPPPGPPNFKDPAALDGFLLVRLKGELLRRTKALEALILIAEGERLEGLALLTEAAEEQVEEWENDPPQEESFLFNLLGEQYLELGAPRLAVECFERTLETVFHDGFALAGLVVAHAQSGETEAAREAMAKLQVVWSDADRPNRWLAAAEATGIEAEPRLDAPIEQRNYKTEILDVMGPSLWIPTDAPSLTARDASGEEVELADFEGQNVVAIFYLGDECVHCMEQIAAAEEHLEALSDLNAIVLAISKDEVEEIAEQQPDFGLTLLSDEEFAAARRFKSFDDFEEIELHSTFIIDLEGRVHWSRIGGEPFTDFDFIEAELARINRTMGESIAAAEAEPATELAGGSAPR